MAVLSFPNKAKRGESRKILRHVLKGNGPPRGDPLRDLFGGELAESALQCLPALLRVEDERCPIIALNLIVFAYDRRLFRIETA